MDGLRVGGQALPDGVLMRTERAWAIARADGSVARGPMPVNPFRNVPGLRVLAGLVNGLRVAAGGRGRGAGRGRSRTRLVRLLVVVVAAELALSLLSESLRAVLPAGRLAWLSQAVPWVAVVAALRLLAPPAIWRYHGAEHKAVAAYETGVDLGDTGAVLACPRVHNRCGSNLVVLLAVASVAAGGLPGLLQLPVLLVAMAAAAELVSLAARHPRAAWSRLVLGGGRFLQRKVTTAEPDAAQQAVGCRALQVALAEHDRLAGASLVSAAARP